MATKQGSSEEAVSLYSKGNEAFVEENYAAAIELYTEAIKLDDSNSNFYACRAHALQKLDKHSAAKSDAEKAIQLNPSNAKGYLRKGIACFNLGEYQEAKKAFIAGQNFEAAGFQQWIVWCEERLGTQSSSSQVEPQVPSEKVDTAVIAPVVQQNPVQPEKIKHDWYQTDTHVCITVLAKNLDPKNVDVTFEEQNVTMNAKLPNGNDYVLDLNLAHLITPHQSTYSVMKTKVEIKLKKAEGIRWSTLEENADTRVKTAPGSSTAEVPTYPSSSRKKKDWDKIEVEIKKEESGEKAEGEAALNELFRKIYGEGSDEVKRAMNKSFMESGGTVLSTNWNEVAKSKVDVKPPDGMEHRKWDA